mgnify:FL=1
MSYKKLYNFLSTILTCPLNAEISIIPYSRSVLKTTRENLLMVKQQTDYQSDDLMADSLQIENYLKQGRSCHLCTVHLGIEDGISSYLERYQLASPQQKFKIFLFSTFYGQKIQRFLEEIRGKQYV